jgi:UPF0042 nucleotide-binding protein
VIEYLVIAGMSGAGRSTVAAALEDAGWYVIDNMPPSLLGRLDSALERSGGVQERVAVVVGRGGGAQAAEVLPAVDALRDVLVRRYEGTRRRHPVAGAGVEGAIDDERKMLGPLRERADVVLDTGPLNVNQLRTRVLGLFGDESGEGMRTSVVSFGYTHGLPLDADLVFDCRFLPNPHWVEELRPFSGLDEPVRAFVLGHEQTTEFLDQLDGLLATLLPAYQAEGKSYLTIAMGCTGGRHRSVVLAEELGRRLEGRGLRASVSHRDVER